MSTGPGFTADDRSLAAPRGEVSIDPLTATTVEDRPAGPPWAPAVEDHVEQVSAPLRVVALVMAVGLAGFAGWVLWMAWSLFADGWTGRAPMEKRWIGGLLIAVPLLLVPARRLWLVARRGVDPEPEGEVIGAVESRAFLEAVERHDLRLAETEDRREHEGAPVTQGG